MIQVSILHRRARIVLENSFVSFEIPYKESKDQKSFGFAESKTQRGTYCHASGVNMMGPNMITKGISQIVFALAGCGKTAVFPQPVKPIAEPVFRLRLFFDRKSRPG
jgi:hypothetical protein